MAITFPRAIPEAGALQHSFELQRVDYLSPEGAGRIGSVTAGWPLWHMTLGLNSLKERDADIWRAWLMMQRGSGRLFYGTDFSRPAPRWHRERGTPFTTPTEWAQTIDAAGNAVLALVGAPAPDGLVLSLGDYIGFRWGTAGQRSLVRVCEGGASAADGTLSVTVEPPVHAVTPADATINLVKPDCLMRIVTGGTQLGDQMRGGIYTAAGGKVEAIQEIIA